MSYRSTGVRQTDDGWLVDGELTLRGITRQVPLAVEITGLSQTADHSRRVAFSATAQINRSDFAIHIPMEANGVVVGDKVSIDLALEAVRQT
jgi:polyisoprenoid-binding protein YceI